MLSRQRLPFKIAMSFGLLLLVVLAVGGLAVWKMGGVGYLQERMDQAHVRQVAIVNTLERHWARAVSDLRGYVVGNEHDLLESGRQGLAGVRESLQQAAQLAEGFPELVELGQRAQKGLALLQRYEELVASTKEGRDQLNDYQEYMETAQKQFFQNAFQLLGEENQTLSADLVAGAERERLVPRQERIGLLGRVIEMGSQAWLARYGLQTGVADAAVVDGINMTLEDMRGSYDELVSQSRREPQVQMKLAASRSNAEQYKSLLSAWLEQWWALKELRQQGQALDAEMTALAQAANDQGLAGVSEASGKTVQSLSSASRRVIEGVGSALLLGLILTVVLCRGLTRPIEAVVADLGMGVLQVAETSRQISQASQVQAEGSSQQAASQEESTAAMEQMAAITQDNAGHAQRANQLVKQTVEAAQEAGLVMNRLAHSMARISAASRETERIVHFIEDIAFQTNLLALNAAVEAARAGQAGAGFAVVADEVRRLALKTSRAAQEAANIITQTLIKVDEGAQLAGEAKESFIQVEAASLEAGGCMDDISAASYQQAQGIAQLNLTVAEMDSATQHQAAISQQTAAAAEELSRQSERMKKVVARLEGLVNGRGHQYPAS